MIADLRLARAQAVAADLKARACQVEAVDIDLADATAVAELVQGLERDWGRLDILIHNAGYFPLTPFAEITPPILERTLAVNLSALFWLTQAALPMFQRQGAGCVLVTSSVTGPRVAYPGLSHYAASKAGSTVSSATPLWNWPVMACASMVSSPGMIATPAMANLGDDQVNGDIAEPGTVGTTRLCRGSAGAMLFLASDLPLTSPDRHIVVDGGSTLPEV